MNKVRTIPCEIGSNKGWTVFYGKKLVGFIHKSDDGAFKYYCETHSEYGPSFYCNIKREGIEQMIASGWF